MHTLINRNIQRRRTTTAYLAESYYNDWLGCRQLWCEVTANCVSCCLWLSNTDVSAQPVIGYQQLLIHAYHLGLLWSQSFQFVSQFSSCRTIIYCPAEPHDGHPARSVVYGVLSVCSAGINEHFLQVCQFLDWYLCNLKYNNIKYMVFFESPVTINSYNKDFKTFLTQNYRTRNFVIGNWLVQ